MVNPKAERIGLSRVISDLIELNNLYADNNIPDACIKAREIAVHVLPHLEAFREEDPVLKKSKGYKGFLKGVQRYEKAKCPKPTDRKYSNEVDNLFRALFFSIHQVIMGFDDKQLQDWMRNFMVEAMAIKDKRARQPLFWKRMIEDLRNKL